MTTKPKPKRKRSILRFGLAIAKWFFVAFVVLLLAVFIFLQTQFGRDYVGQVALSFLNDEIAGTVEVGRVATITWGRIEFEDVIITDPEGRPVIEARYAAAWPDIAAILGGEIALAWATVDGGIVTFREGEDGVITIESTFDEAVWTPSSFTEETPPDRIRISNATVTNTIVQVEYPEALGARVEFSHLSGEVLAAIHIRDRIRVYVSEASGVVTGPRGEIFQLESLAGGLEVGWDDAVTQGVAMLVSQSGRVAVDVEVVGIDGDAPVRIDATVELEGVRAELLESFELTELAENAPQWVSGTVHAAGTPSDLDIALDLETPGGPFTVAGRLRSPLHLDARLNTPRLALQAVSSVLPELTVATGLDVSVEPGEVTGDWRLALDLEHATVDEHAVPPLSAAGVVSQDRVTIESFHVPQEGDRGVQVAGTAGFDGTFDVDVRATDLDLAEIPEIRTLAPGLYGVLNSTLHVRLDSVAELTFDVSGELSLDRAGFDDISVESLAISGSASGQLANPLFNLDISTKSIVTQDVSVDSADVLLSGGPRTYRVDGDVQLTGGPLANLALSASLDGESVTLNGNLAVMQDGERLDASLTRVRIDPTAVRVEHLLLSHPLFAAEGSGSYAFDGAPQVEVDLERLDLSIFDGRLGLPDLSLAGEISGRFSLGGTTRAPELELDARLQNGAAGPIEDAEATVRLEVDRSGFVTETNVQLGDSAELSIRGGARFGRPRGLIRTLRRADYDVTVDAAIGDMAEVHEVFADVPLTGGSVSATVTLDGELTAPNITAELHGSALEVPDVEPVNVSSLLHFEDETLTAELDVYDDLGQLLIAGGRIAVDWEDILDGRVVEAFDRVDWVLNAEVPPRSAASLRLPIEGLDGVPLDVSAEVSLIGDPDGVPLGEIQLNLYSSPDDSRSLDDRCPTELPFALSVNADLGQHFPSLALVGEIGGLTVLDGSVSAQTPLEDLVSDDGIDLPTEVSVAVVLDALDLAALPVICEIGEGSLSGRLTVNGLLTDSPLAELILEGRALAYQDSDAIDLDVTARAPAHELAADIVLVDSSSGRASLSANIPIDWGIDSLLPVVADGPVSGRLDLNELALSPLAIVIPDLLRVGGLVSGELTVEGPLETLVPAGEISIQGGHLTVAGLEQRLHEIEGRLRIEPDVLIIENLRARDRDGMVALDGAIEMSGLAPEVVTVTLSADDFPVRSEGATIARVDATANIVAEVGSEATDAEIRFENLAVRLPDLDVAGVQDLDPHPDIVYTDVENLVGAVEEWADEVDWEPTDELTHAIHARVIASEPFWLRSSEFDVQLVLDLAIDADEAGLRIDGPINVRRGFMAFLGKPFDLTHGEVTFTGSAEIDPFLRIVAEHRPPRYPGEKVEITISGRLSSPVIDLTSTVPNVETQAQVIQLLLTGQVTRREDQEETADVDVGAALSGLTAGLITDAARRQLGDAAPMISVQTGQDSRDLQVRAGFVADSLIPSFLASVVTGMYVEGYVGSETVGEGTQTQVYQTGGFLLEWYYRHGWLNRTTYEPPSNWSFDALWQP